MTEIVVKSAVYGAIANNNYCEAADVTTSLQQLVKENPAAVAINVTTLGGDPAYGFHKSLGAFVTRDGVTYGYTCLDNQTLNFTTGGTIFP